MNLDDKYIYLFVRQNLFSWQQMVHISHAAFLGGTFTDGFCQKRHQLSGHPSLVVVGVEDEAALRAVALDLGNLEIECSLWADPDAKEGDEDFGLLSIVSQPLSKRERNKLHKYRPWSERNNVHPKATRDCAPGDMQA